MLIIRILVGICFVSSAVLQCGHLCLLQSLGITVDRYVYIVKPLRYPHIVTHRRTFLAVSGIWITACCLFTVLYIHYRSFSVEIQSLCYLPRSVAYFTVAFVGYLPLALKFLLNFHIFFAARKQGISVFYRKQ